MIARILRLLGYRRRVSTKLTKAYEDRRRREIRKALAMFGGDPA
jgi:uncharacterized protein with PIN domain